ncbi:MAG: hypothetical protein ABI679_07055 [Gemmatimonadota bacterium]
MRAQLEHDFERFRAELPRDFPALVRERYRIDLSARYLGEPIPHPVGKASGQLSLKQEQLETDADAGLAFVVLKTVIAQDERGDQSMAAWAIHETRMTVESIHSQDGRIGWTVTWKGRGWDRPFEAYLDLVRAGRDLTGQGRLLVAPSIKYHLPLLDEPFREAEYRFTTEAVAKAWGPSPLLLEKDFSPTLSGDPLADERDRILRWIGEVPRLVRAHAPHGARVALKLMNARFGDEFQVEMLRQSAAGGADAAIVFNRLFDPERKVAYGGWDLSNQNLRVLTLARESGASENIRLSGTGNICSGRVLLNYARLGCESVQLHTFFQLPLGAYASTGGSRTSRALHMLIFHPQDGLLAGMLELEHAGRLHRQNGELRFLDIAANP